MLALALTSLFFGFVVYAVKVEGLRDPLLTRRTGEVVLLTEETAYGQNLMLQVESKIPFPTRWDPAFDEDTMGRIEAGIERLLGSVLPYRSPLQPLPPIHESRGLPSVFKEQSGFFLGSVDQWEGLKKSWHVSPDATQDDLQISVLMVADEDIEKRLPTGELLLPDHLITDESFGQSFRFLVGIDSLGVVRGCLSLSGGSMEVVKPTERQKLLAAWLRHMMFRPVEGNSLMIGVIELQIEAREK